MRIALIVVCLTAQLVASGSNSFYVSDSLKWQRGYRPGQPTQPFAEGRILVFDPDGSFAAIACTLYKQPNGQLSPILSEGYSFVSGKWARHAATIVATYRSVYASVQLPRKGDEEVKEVFTYRPSGREQRLARWLRSKGDCFVPLDNLAAPEEIRKLIAFHLHPPN